MKKRLLSMLMVLAMTLTFMAPAAMAAGLESGSNPMDGGDGSETETVSVSIDPFEDFEDFPDNDKLFDAYVKKQLYGLNLGTSTLSNYGETMLTGDNKTLYTQMKTLIEGIAAGNRTSTQSIALTQNATNATWSSVNDMTAGVRLVLNYLLADCPESFFWYDKSHNDGSTLAFSYRHTTLSPYSVTEVSFVVSSDYRAAGSGLYAVDTSKLQAISTATTNAKNIVNSSDLNGKSDYERLVAYKNAICELNTYNTDAADKSKNTPYGDPWQIIYVFDGNPDTNVVCEGYSKAFQYLCDQTKFTSPKVKCYTVTGRMDGGTGGGGGHMWNIVTMDDGSNYLVDVTNCDNGSTGYPDKLFLKGVAPSSRTITFTVTTTTETGTENKDITKTYNYQVNCGSAANTIYYLYDSADLGNPDMEQMWGNVLNLSTTDYVPKKALTEGMVKLSAASATSTYNGADQKPNVTVTDGTTQLAAGTDYTVEITLDDESVEEVKNAGTYTIAVTGTGSYTGTVEKKFTIEKATPTLTVEPADTLELKTGAMGNLKITLTGEGGDNLTPTVTSSNPNVAAVEQTATDCTVTAKAKGNATITVAYAGDTNYNAAESETVTVTVTDLAVKSIAVTTPPTKAVYTYGESFVGTGLVVTITYDDNSTGTADYSADMKVTPDLSTVELSEVGADGSVELTLSYQEQTAKFNVKLSAKDLADTVVSQPADATYDGTQKTPEVTVTDGGKTLRKDTDYTVAYGTNTDAGNGTVTVTGMNNYSGTVTRTFSIAQATPDIGTVKLAEEAVVYATTAPGDVELTRTDETIPGTLKLTAPENFTGKGGTTVTGTWTFTPTGTAANNYTTATGTVSIPVTDRVVEKIEVATSPETNYVYGDAFVPDGLVIKVTYNNGQTENITYGADKGFEFAPTALGDVGTKNVTVTYSKKTVDISVTVTAKPLTGAEVTVAAGSVYNGSAQEPAVTVKLDNKTLTKGTDYTVAYTGNTDAGTNTATATVTGTGNYKETASATFSIAQGTPSGTVKLGGDAGTIYEGALAGDVARKLVWEGTPAATEGTLSLTSPEKLTAGANVCTWKFVPTDASNWNEKTGEITITAAARSVSEIKVTTQPTKKEYTYETPFDPAGMVVTVTYDNGDVETISTFPDARISYSDDLGDKSDDASVTLTWVSDSTKTCEVTGIKVTPKILDVSGIRWDYTGTPFTYDGNEKTVTLVGDKPAELANTLMGGNSATDAGEYTATVTFVVSDSVSNKSNYEITGTNPVEVKWRINPANPDGSSVNLTVSSSDTDEVTTVPVSEFTAVPGTLELGTVPSGSGVEATLAADSESIVVKLADGAAAGTVTIPVTFTPTSGNYKPVTTWNLVVKITALKIPTVSVDGYTTTYKGAAVTVGDLTTKTATDEDGEALTGTWTFVGDAPVNAGTYTCKLNFEPDDEAYDAVQTKAFTVTINKAPVTVTGITRTITEGAAIPDPPLYRIEGLVGGDSSLVPAPTVTHEIPNPTTVGTYPITVTGPATSSDGNYSITYTNGTLTVSPATIAVTGVTLSPGTLALTEGGTGTLTASVAPAGATNRAVTWSSSDPSVATISNGTVTALRAGTAVITVTTEDGGFTATCTVTVSASSEAEEPVYPVSPNRPSYPGTTDTGNTNTDTNTPSNPPAVTDSPVVTPSAPVNNGTAEAVVSKDMADQLVEQAASGSDTVVIAPVVTGSVSQTEVTIPASAVSGIAGSSNAELRVETPAADITIPNSALADLGRQGGSVVVTAGESNGIVSIEITANGKTVDQVPGGVKAEIPVSCTPGTVAMVIDENGDLTPVRKSYADDNGRTMTVPLEGSAQMVFVDNSKSFNDVASTSWAADAVAFASSRELMNGVGSDNFSPNTTMTRGMLAVVLHNLEGNPSAAYSGSFSDVGSSAWYAQAVQWAADNSIIGGVGEGMFAPDAPITREQLVVMLYRYAGQPTASGSLGSFSDSGSVSGWAQQAMAWAVANGIINGSNGALNPQSSATRAEVAQMLMNFVTSGVI